MGCFGTWQPLSCIKLGRSKDGGDAFPSFHAMKHRLFLFLQGSPPPSQPTNRGCVDHGPESSLGLWAHLVQRLPGCLRYMAIPPRLDSYPLEQARPGRTRQSCSKGSAPPLPSPPRSWLRWQSACPSPPLNLINVLMYLQRSVGLRPSAVLFLVGRPGRIQRVLPNLPLIQLMDLFQRR